MVAEFVRAKNFMVVHGGESLEAGGFETTIYGLVCRSNTKLG